MGYESLGGKNRTDRKTRQEGKVKSLRGLSETSAGDGGEAGGAGSCQPWQVVYWDDRVKSSRDPFGVS